MNHPALAHDEPHTTSILRRTAVGTEPLVMTDIYERDCNIAVWQRQLSTELERDISALLQNNTRLQSSMVVSPDTVHKSIRQALGKNSSDALCDDIAQLVDMFCCLFDLQRTGLRLTSLDRAMCPKFHVDRVPCRLVTTYQGAATEWLPHAAVDRSKLGIGSNGQPDETSGLYQHADDINQVQQGDIALLKGELWDGNEGAGLVHRSPALKAGERRLLLTLDFN